MFIKTEAINQTKVRKQAGRQNIDMIKDRSNDENKEIPEIAIKKSVKEDERSLSQEKLEDSVDMGNKMLLDKRLKFEIHKKSNRTMVKLIDRKTDKIIREIPTEEFLNIVGRIEEFMGVFVDERV